VQAIERQDLKDAILWDLEVALSGKFNLILFTNHFIIDNRKTI